MDPHGKAAGLRRNVASLSVRFEKEKFSAKRFPTVRISSSRQLMKNIPISGSDKTCSKETSANSPSKKATWEQSRVSVWAYAAYFFLIIITITQEESKLLGNGRKDRKRSNRPWSGHSTVTVYAWWLDWSELHGRPGLNSHYGLKNFLIFLNKD